MTLFWSSLILIAFIYGLATGKSELLSNTMANVGKETIEFIIPFIAITCFFNGLVEIAFQTTL